MTDATFDGSWTAPTCERGVMTLEKWVENRQERWEAEASADAQPAVRWVTNTLATPPDAAWAMPRTGCPEFEPYPGFERVLPTDWSTRSSAEGIHQRSRSHPTHFRRHANQIHCPGG
jgi:hypothetical protein